jgi:phosphatidylserine decarboxylase
MTLHKEGTATLIISALVLAGLSFSVWYALPAFGYIFSAIAVILYIFLLSFFRKPDRVFPAVSDNVIISPADGKVVVIEDVFEPEYLQTNCKMVSVFMSPLNVHINWYPAKGKVLYEKYHPGKYLVAWNPKSSTENERTTVVLETPNGKILMRQVAGALARRIVCYARKDQEVTGGQEMGFIKFGSRVDIYLPSDADIQVGLDQVVKGCHTPLATLK